MSKGLLKTCERCQKQFSCGASDKDRPCWCFKYPSEKSFPEYKDCLCQKCFEELSFGEDEDFYEENGFLVFTARYHLKRGYCCESGCRHCPYKK